MINKHRS